MLFCGATLFSSASSPLVIAVLFVVYFCAVRCDRFVDKGGYLLWNRDRNVLQGAEDRLEFSFRYCNDRGLLIYRQGDGRNYFALGVTSGRLYIETSIDDKVAEVFIGMSNQDVVLKNQTHEVLITGLWGLDSNMRITINGTEYPPQILNVVPIELSFSTIVGETLVGGYKDIADLRLTTDRLKTYPITCIFYIRVGENLSNITLNSADDSQGDSETCNVCQQPSTVSMTTLTSFIEMNVDKTPTTTTFINFRFRTKVTNGLLLYFGGPAYLAVYLRNGALVLTLNTMGSGRGENATMQPTSEAPFNDGEWQEITIQRDNNVATMYSLARDEVIEVEFGGSSDTAHVLNAETLYMGGVRDPVAGLPPDLPSFRGCLDDLRFSVIGGWPFPYDFQRDEANNRTVEFFSCVANGTCESYPCKEDQGEACDLGVCECAEGFNMTTDEPLTCENIDDCDPDPCQNGAICIDLIADHNCACTEQYKGKNCTVERNCYLYPCDNGGSCTELDTLMHGEIGRNCSCAHGFIGQNCSVVNYCADNPCSPGTCNNYLTGYNCTCPDDPDETFKDRKDCRPPGVRGAIQISDGALSVVLVGVAILLVVVIVFLAFRRQYKKGIEQALLDYAQNPAYEESRENVMDYGEEGYGEEDQDTFDVNVIQSAGDTLKQHKNFPVLSQEDAVEVADFINSQLGDAEVHTNAGAMDQTMSFADEGRGSLASSLSSLNSSSTEDEQSYDYLEHWGPRFSRLSNMFNDGESDSD